MDLKTYISPFIKSSGSVFFLILWNDNIVSFAWTQDSHLCFVSIWTTITLNLNNLLDTYPFPTYISFLDKITLFDSNTIRDLCLFKSNSKMRLFQISSMYKTLFRVSFSYKSSFFFEFLSQTWLNSPYRAFHHFQ